MTVPPPRQGQIWEHVSSTIIGDGSVNGRYELTSLEGNAGASGQAYDPIVHLTNQETGGVAKVYRKSLVEGPKRRPHPHWRFVG